MGILVTSVTQDEDLSTTCKTNVNFFLKCLVFFFYEFIRVREMVYLFGRSKILNFKKHI